MTIQKTVGFWHCHRGVVGDSWCHRMIYLYIYIYLYRLSQEECASIREGVPYAKIYRGNPKRLYPKWNCYGDYGQRCLKIWQLLLTYLLPNTYWNWQDYVVSVMLIAVRNIKVTCGWHKAIKLNYKNTLNRVIVVLRFPSTIHDTSIASRDVTRLSAIPLQICTKMMQPFCRHALI